MWPQVLSKNKVKEYASLLTTKGRREYGCFLVEGQRAVDELFNSSLLNCNGIVATRTWIESNSPKLRPGRFPVYEVGEKEIKKMSALNTPPQVIGVYEMPSFKIPEPSALKNTLTLLLNGLQDPGNMGTMIRLADWWGIQNILCTPGTVDCFNSKVVQSAMGALGRVKVIRLNKPIEWLEKAIASNIPVYGTFLEGENIFMADNLTPGIIVMGNEGNGIEKEISELVSRKLLIPPYPTDVKHIESLNVAMAAGIVVSRFIASKFKL